MLITILDGYVDEPSILGVPPYISPYIREVAGVCKELNVNCRYTTIDQWRSGEKITGDVLVVIGGAVVPGKYLRTYPASKREILEIAKSFKGLKILGGGLARFRLIKDGFDYYARKDVDALLYDVLTDNFSEHRFHTLDEWNRWLIQGAPIVKNHPDFPDSIIVEIETFRGCPRYIGGGCSFCIEPLYGKPIFREVEDIIKEMRILKEIGVQNFRIGGQTCIYSYKAYGVGDKDVVQPNVGAISKLFKMAWSLHPSVLHVDNANPAVIANYPKESEQVTEIIAKYTTSGNVLSFGMESADPQVILKNNLNAKPEEVMEAIRLVNEIGGDRGDNGMPRLLPGLNFICGLWGERKETYVLNYKFLEKVKETGYLLRRINIRQAASTRNNFKLKYHHECWKFRELVRNNIDSYMLQRVVPKRTVIRNVFLEVKKGKYTYGRQIGSYPIVVVLPYSTEIRRFVDIKVIGHGQRSITGIEYPLEIKDMKYSILKVIPGMNDRKAASAIRDNRLPKEMLLKKYPELKEYIT